jgi:hypothetical protein
VSDVSKHGFDRRQISVNVGDDCDTHCPDHVQ